jgi:putative transposase
MWIQKYHPRKVFSKRKNISEYIVDETLPKVGSQYLWLWVTIEPENRQILAVTVSRERNILIAERFISRIVKIHGKHTISTDGNTWYPMACKFLKLKHHIHSLLAKKENSLIERTMQYIKDRTEIFDNYFPCKKIGCKLKHVKNWLNLFVDYHNNELKALK